MNRGERWIISTLLLGISLMTSFDLLTDLKEGVDWWHVIIEAFVAGLALVGIFFLVRGTFSLKRSLKLEKELSAQLREESRHWKSNSKIFIEGLSQSISEQLDNWQLTKAEKEVAFLLIKGFSLKEIAEFRETAEKTTRTQATAIYSKSGLSGRPQLSAFFLEDLLIPQGS
jgi:DNA-binding CsgD family transcriptional regulator